MHATVQPCSAWHSAHLSSSPVFCNSGTDTEKMMWCTVCISIGWVAVTHAISLSKSISTYVDELIRAACWDETSRSGIVSIPAPKQMQIKIQINVFSPRRNWVVLIVSSQKMTGFCYPELTQNKALSNCSPWAWVQKSVSPGGGAQTEKEQVDFCVIFFFLYGWKIQAIYIFLGLLCFLDDLSQ